MRRTRARGAGGNKYGNRKTRIDGILFDSAREARRYAELKLLERAGEIERLELQPEYVLQPGFDFCGRRERPIKYRADFRYIDRRSGEQVVEDAKGVETEAFKLKKKMMAYVHGVDVRLV